jgi:hypothetical protein
MLRPFDGPRRAALDAICQAARTAARALETRDAGPGRGAHQESPHLCPTHLCLHRAQANFDQLLQSLDSSSPDGQIALACLRSVTSPCASAWLEALLAAHTLTLPDPDFRAAIR